MNIEEFKTKYPDLHNAIFEEGKKEGHAAGLIEGETSGLEKGKTEAQDQAKEAGAKAEMERIQGVEAQLVPGHEKLIQQLKYDGKTTSEQAEIQMWRADNALKLNMKAQLDADAVNAVDHIANQGLGDDVSSLPDGPEKWKVEYEKSADLQKEFKACETYVAYMKGVAAGDVKILGKKAK